VSSQPKAPGERRQSRWGALGAVVTLIALAALFGALLSIPHPITVLLSS
jgi:hypothetical protein